MIRLVGYTTGLTFYRLCVIGVLRWVCVLIVTLWLVSWCVIWCRFDCWFMDLLTVDLGDCLLDWWFAYWLVFCYWLGLLYLYGLGGCVYFGVVCVVCCLFWICLLFVVIWCFVCFLACVFDFIVVALCFWLFRGFGRIALWLFYGWGGSECGFIGLCFDCTCWFSYFGVAAALIWFVLCWFWLLVFVLVCLCGCGLFWICLRLSFGLWYLLFVRFMICFSFVFELDPLVGLSLGLECDCWLIW